MTLDPTAIPIRFDPLTQRMRGIAIHGDTPFDVPFISHVTENLWVGGCQRGMYLPYEIKHVVSMYPWEKYNLHDDADRVEFTAYDGENDTMDIFHTAALKTIGLMKDGATLVHCQAGLNRSSTVAALALFGMGWEMQDAIDLLRDKRSPAVLCNRDLENWLLETVGI